MVYWERSQQPITSRPVFGSRFTPALVFFVSILRDGSKELPDRYQTLRDPHVWSCFATAKYGTITFDPVLLPQGAVSSTMSTLCSRITAVKCGTIMPDSFLLPQIAVSVRYQRDVHFVFPHYCRIKRHLELRKNVKVLDRHGLHVQTWIKLAECILQLYKTGSGT